MNVNLLISSGFCRYTDVSFRSFRSILQQEHVIKCLGKCPCDTDIKKGGRRQQKSGRALWLLDISSTQPPQTYLFGEVDGISVKSVSQMRVQLESWCNLHNLQNNTILLIMPQGPQHCQNSRQCQDNNYEHLYLRRNKIIRKIMK